ncbi:cell division protein FtsK [Mammaliicoccus sciuri]|uniref:Cell division protein FtsK n=2 Tax=Sporosarcina newyorkensis TaxID=759851 RepID=A0A1T4YLR5_9BACL|nr:MULTISPECIES: hypothetical protein [Sporosarcina]EGQ21687.1 hypothetical protein HMPREF9372_3233 [Sporosarcina newyorkensis 2681]MBY0221289.1 cell division protein FtsK [Sporosarcina aquimarina]SKB02508.1 hypothetical protein SAMN04244570_2978 [Sporosarcina newyorkensis]
MKSFNKLIELLNEMKDIDVWGDKKDGLSENEKEYLDRIPTQNPYGLIGLIFGGIAFAFGPQYGFIPVITLIFCIVTLFTYDKEREDNPWPFYVGIMLSLIGLIMFIIGEVHQLIL